MKNRRNIIVAFLLCACLIVGVGYAALTDTLDITGSADITLSTLEAEFNQDIYFTAAVANDEGNTASVNNDNNDKASFTANNLAKKGDKATFTFTLTNDGNTDLDALITPKLDSEKGNTQPQYFNIYSDWQGEAKILEVGKTITYTVTVELIDTPQAALSGSFLIELVATSVESNS